MGNEILLRSGKRPETERTIEAVKRAKRLFTDASRMYPASVTTQGAYIALELQKSEPGETAFGLGRALAGDLTAIDSLVITADSTHRARNRAIRITRSSVRDIVGADFAHAELMKVFSGDELHRILDRYTTLRAIDHFDEPAFRRGVHARLQIEYDALGSTSEMTTRINVLTNDIAPLRLAF